MCHNIIILYTFGHFIKCILCTHHITIIYLIILISKYIIILYYIIFTSVIMGFYETNKIYINILYVKTQN